MLTARTLTLVASAILCCLTRTHAQTETPRIALHVSNLTSDERDALNHDLNDRGDLRIVFACVPAGILILEPVNGERRADQVRTLAAAALNARIPTQRRSEATMSLEEAESRCSTVRNR